MIPPVTVTPMIGNHIYMRTHVITAVRSQWGNYVGSALRQTFLRCPQGKK